MVAPTPMHTLSNTQFDKNGTSMINGVNRTTFEFFETPKMSTYLLAFIVSKYEGLTNSNNTFGVYARPGAKEQTALALSFGQEMLAKLGDYVGIDYYSVDKVKKMDMAVRKR
jgi:aminopeptidase N